MSEAGNKLACAGVKRSVAKAKLSHKLYKKTLLGDDDGPADDVYIEQKTIQSRNHNVKTVKQVRVGLSSLDEKRYVCQNNVQTLSFGHHKISEMEEFDRNFGKGSYLDNFPM